MALLQIRKYPDPCLKETCSPVETIDERILKLLENMAETMYANLGIGLAAPQVGESFRIIVLDVRSDDQQSGLLKLINPEIVDKQEKIKWEEGCLSLPELIVEVDRYNKVWVQALCPDGQQTTLEAEGLLSVCLQHEIDHLDGVLLVDRLSSLRRSFYQKKRLKEDSQP